MVRDIRYVNLVSCPRGVKLRNIGNPPITPEQHKMTSNIFVINNIYNIISATKFVSCSS